MVKGFRIKDGVQFKRAHLYPHIMIMIDVAVETAPEMTDGWVWITCAYRNIRESLDFHEHCQAFDFRCRNILTPLGQEGIEVLGHAWADRQREALRSDYDILAHGIGNSFHVHTEFDPR